MIALIVAHSINRVIGKNGIIPWHIKDDLLRFKQLTTDNIVIFGRRSFEEIGKPLKNRINIVISSTKNFNSENCYTVKSLQEAINLCHNKYKSKDIFICGGEKLYKESIDIVDTMYITVINSYYDGDTYFPKFDENKFEKQIYKNNHNKTHFSFYIYKRK